MLSRRNRLLLQWVLAKCTRTLATSRRHRCVSEVFGSHFYKGPTPPARRAPNQADPPGRGVSPLRNTPRTYEGAGPLTLLFGPEKAKAPGNHSRGAGSHRAVAASSRSPLLCSGAGLAHAQGTDWPKGAAQYIPPMPPPGVAGAGFSSFFSTTTHSVVRSKPAIDAAFWSAVRVTLVGSITPAFTRSSNASVAAL
jgi:hypothetical protein